MNKRAVKRLAAAYAANVMARYDAAVDRERRFFEACRKYLRETRPDPFEYVPLLGWPKGR